MESSVDIPVVLKHSNVTLDSHDSTTNSDDSGFRLGDKDKIMLDQFKLIHNRFNDVNAAFYICSDERDELIRVNKILQTEVSLLNDRILKLKDWIDEKGKLEYEDKKEMLCEIIRQRNGLNISEPIMIYMQKESQDELLHKVHEELECVKKQLTQEKGQSSGMVEAAVDILKEEILALRLKNEALEVERTKSNQRLMTLLEESDIKLKEALAAEKDTADQYEKFREISKQDIDGLRADRDNLQSQLNLIVRDFGIESDVCVSTPVSKRSAKEASSELPFVTPMSNPNRIAGVQRKVKDLEEQNMLKDSQIDELKFNVKALKGTLTGLENCVESHQIEVGDLKAKIRAMQLDLEAANAQKDNSLALLEEYKSTNSQHAIQLNELRRHLDDSKNQYFRLEAGSTLKSDKQEKIIHERNLTIQKLDDCLKNFKKDLLLSREESQTFQMKVDELEKSCDIAQSELTIFISASRRVFDTLAPLVNSIREKRQSSEIEETKSGVCVVPKRVEISVIAIMRLWSIAGNALGMSHIPLLFEEEDHDVGCKELSVGGEDIVVSGSSVLVTKQKRKFNPGLKGYILDMLTSATVWVAIGSAIFISSIFFVWLAANTVYHAHDASGSALPQFLPNNVSSISHLPAFPSIIASSPTPPLELANVLSDLYNSRSNFDLFRFGSAIKGLIQILLEVACTTASGVGAAIGN